MEVTLKSSHLVKCSSTTHFIELVNEFFNKSFDIDLNSGFHLFFINDPISRDWFFSIKLHKNKRCRIQVRGHNLIINGFMPSHYLQRLFSIIIFAEFRSYAKCSKASDSISVGDLLFDFKDHLKVKYG